MSKTHMPRTIAATLGLIGFVAAGVLVLLPLPTVNALGGTVAWCGPGTSSASALRVETRPDVVNEGGSAATRDPAADTANARALVQVCKGEADTRFQQAGVVLLAGAVLGCGALWVGRKTASPTA